MGKSEKAPAWLHYCCARHERSACSRQGDGQRVKLKEDASRAPLGPMGKLPATISDEELLQLVLVGSADALSVLYDKYQGAIYRYALRMSGSEAMAEDVTQDVFMALMRDAAQYNPARGSLLAYLYGMARYRVLRRLERDRQFVSILDERQESSADEQLVSQDDPFERLTRDEVIKIVRQAILALPAHYREVIILCNLQEMSYEQAAEVIGCPVGTVRSRLHRARAMLIEKLRVLREAGLTRPGAAAASFAL
jgi:RNA polymerase sigma-70 factor (ECF subfamily)